MEKRILIASIIFYVINFLSLITLVILGKVIPDFIGKGFVVNSVIVFICSLRCAVRYHKKKTLL